MPENPSGRTTGRQKADYQPTTERDGGRFREQHATINHFICQTLMPEWEADGWGYEHDDDPPTVPDVERGFLLERDGVRVLVTVALVEYDEPVQTHPDANTYPATCDTCDDEGWVNIDPVHTEDGGYYEQGDPCPECSDEQTDREDAS